MSDQPFFFISGMFRSGTSLLARMLNVHPALAVASDPYAPLFTAFRNEVAARTFPGRELDPDAPLGDYYFDEDEQQLCAAIGEAGLDLPLTRIDHDTLREQIRQASQATSPRIHEHLNQLSGSSFRELLQQGVDVVRQAYGDASTQQTGFKEVWTSEFVPHILDSFPNAKAILVQRDPRATAAGRNSGGQKFPWHFLGRQWRKLSAFAWELTQNTFEHSDRVLLIRYESLIRRPREHAQEICDFLGVDFDDVLLNPAGYVDGAGQPWGQGSSYIKNSGSFNEESLLRWREKLTVSDCEWVEHLCWPEMSLFQYEPVVMRNWAFPETAIQQVPLIPAEELATWIKAYSITDRQDLLDEFRKERRRWDALTADEAAAPGEQRACCLFPEVYRELRAIVRKPKRGLAARVEENAEAQVE